MQDTILVIVAMIKLQISGTERTIVVIQLTEMMHCKVKFNGTGFIV